MITLSSAGSKGISANINGIQKYFTEWFRVVCEDGVLIKLINSDETIIGEFSDFTVEGSTFDSVDSAISGLSEFLGNFKTGGGSSGNNPNTLPVTLTGTLAAPVFAFAAADFDRVAVAAGRGMPVSVAITDNRTAANKPVDLTGVWPAKWNPVLSQAEVPDPSVARGFYLNGTVPAVRGCVTHNTRKYIELGACYDTSLSCRFNAVTGFYEMAGLTDLTERDVEASANIVWPTYQDMATLSGAASGPVYRVNFPVQAVQVPSSNVLFQAAIPANPTSEDLRLAGGMSYCLFGVVNLIPRKAYFTDAPYGTGVFGVRIKQTAGFLYYFFYFSSLSKIHGVLDISAVASNIPATVFTPRGTLDFRPFGLGVDWNMSSGTMTRDSLVYLLANRRNAVGKTITVTLSATVYAWASVDSDILALLPATDTQGEAVLASV